MYAKLSKCEFWLKINLFATCYLKEWIFVDPKKVEVVLKWEKTTNVIEIHSFLEIAVYYRRFTKGFSTIETPLTQLTRKWKWSNECEKSF